MHFERPYTITMIRVYKTIVKNCLSEIEINYINASHFQILCQAQPFTIY
jgi:hypothetical protein